MWALNNWKDSGDDENNDDEIENENENGNDNDIDEDNNSDVDDNDNDNDVESLFRETWFGFRLYFFMPHLCCNCIIGITVLDTSFIPPL